MLLALAACGAASVAPSPARPTATALAGCGPANARTLAASAAARIYALRQAVFGCSAHTGRRFRLGNATLCIGTQRVGPFAVTGELTAYGSERCGIDTGSTEVIVRRLSDGRQLTADRATSLPLGAESYQSVDSIALGADGDVAWIAVGNSIVMHRTDVEVHKQDRNGERLLDRGAGIHPASLRLSGSKLTWKHGSATRSAAFR